MAASPVITYPITNWSPTNNKYFTDNTTLVVEGIIPAILSNVITGESILLLEYQYQLLRAGTTFPLTSWSSEGAVVGITSSDLQEVSWYLNTEGVIDILEGDEITFNFRTKESDRQNNAITYTISYSSSISLIVDIVNEDVITETVDPPTGTSLKRAKDYIKLIVPSNSISLNTNSQFVGVNFYMALDAGGGSNGYQILNDNYINNVDTSETVSVVTALTDISSTTAEITTNTTRTQTTENTYYTYVFTPDIITKLITQNKIPNIFLSDGVSLSPDTIYYFVMSIVAYDETLSQTIESHYSVELEAKFLDFNSGISAIPTRTSNDVLTSITTRLVSDNNQINIISGSVIRDIMDPITLEFQNFYTVQDFVFRCQSIDALSNFDDANGDGISDPFNTSLAKTNLAIALGITDGNSLQALIDVQFDKWASNFNMTRKGSVAATGTVIFYSRIAPTSDILIPDGTQVSTSPNSATNIPVVNYSVVGNHYMQASNAKYYYNAGLKRYEIEADIVCKVTGSIGNVPAGSITIVSGISPIIQVENDASTNYGEDSESNSNLAARIKLANISFDSGTEGGYLATALKVPGIEQARVQKEGDPLMMRDYDVSTGKHIGGKVDVYIRGERIIQTIDNVTFKYEYPSDVNGDNSSEIFGIVNATEFRLKSLNSKVGVNSPIVFVSAVRNVTRMANYDVTGVIIVGDGDTVILSQSLTNQNIGMATFDVIEVNYQYRSSNTISLRNQPVREIIEVRDSTNTLIDSSKYQIVKNEDPLTTGISNISKYGIEFLFTSVGDFNEFITVTDEQHNVLFNVPTALNYLGALSSTIVIMNSTDTITYVENVDYSITTSTLNTSTYINLLVGSKIRQGDLISASYIASQNFSVTYLYNSLVEEVNSSILDMKHACADVITKEAIKNSVDVSCTVIRQTGVDKGRLQACIQTNVSNFVNTMKTGDTLSQGTLVNIIKSTDGVADIQLPLIRLQKRNGSFIPLDDLGSLNFSIYQKTSNFGVISYITLSSVLTYKTTVNGGPDNLFRTVYEDNVALQMVSDPSEVAQGKGRAYILGNGKIIVSTTDGLPPQTKEYQAAYYVQYDDSDNFVSDINTSEIEYLEIDSVSLKDIEVVDAKVIKRGL